MKLIIAILCLCSTAFGSGKLHVQESYYPETREYKPLLGLSIYEPLFSSKVFAYNSWTGYGSVPVEFKVDAEWFTTKHQLDIQIGNNLTVSPGFQVSYILPYEDLHKSVFARASFKLW